MYADRAKLEPDMVALFNRMIREMDQAYTTWGMDQRKKGERQAAAEAKAREGSKKRSW